MATRVAGKFEPSARLTPANVITVVRLCGAVPLVLLIVEVGAAWATAALWVAIASTDFLDGWVARRQGTTTSGAFLDPLADKVLVVGALAALAAAGAISWAPVAVIAGRELAISAYRTLVGRHGVSVPARPVAKAKTAVQDLAVGLLLVPLVAHHDRWLGRDLVWVAVGLAVLSGTQYLYDAARQPATAGV